MSAQGWSFSLWSALQNPGTSSKSKLPNPQQGNRQKDHCLSRRPEAFKGGVPSHESSPGEGIPSEIDGFYVMF